jgi:hypothetical protein
MSKPVKILWPLADVVAVCLTQANTAGIPLLINGTLATTDTTVATYAQFPGIARTVSITSGGNLAGVQYTIQGTDVFNNPVSETRAGPNATTVYTAQKFNTVTSVTPDTTNATTVRIGTGLTGQTVWYRSDFYRPYNALTVAAFVNAGVVSYTFDTTLDDPADPAGPVLWDVIDGVTTPTIPTATPMINASVSIISTYYFPTNASRILINASDAATHMEISFLQQGLN